MEGKTIIILAVGIAVVAIVVLAAAFFVLNDNGDTSATPTPAPEATPAAATATPAPGATQGTGPTAKPTAAATAAPGGPILMQTNYNRTMNMCFVSLYLNTGASPVDTSNMKIDVVSGGQTYRNVWAPAASDFSPSNGNAMLDPKETLTTQIDTKSLGIPQGQAITIKVMQDTAVLLEQTVSAT